MAADRRRTSVPRGAGMITPYGPWMTFGGEPITGKPRPSFVVHADPPSLTMSAEQQGFVRNAYAKFCTGIATSCIPNGYHSREYSAADGTRVRTESINGAHRVQAWISGRGELSADPWFYQGVVRHPQSPASGAGRFIPFTINKSVTRLKPLSPGFISSDAPPYVYDTEYFRSTATFTESGSVQTFPQWLTDPGAALWEGFVGSTSSTRQLLHNDRLLSAGAGSWNTTTRYRDSEIGEILVVRTETSAQGMFTWGANSYARTITAFRMDYTAWREEDYLGFLGSGASTADWFTHEVFSLSGKKIHTSTTPVSFTPSVPNPPTPSWFNTNTVWGRLRKGYYHSVVGGPFWPGSTAAHFYEWGANEIRAQTAVAHDTTGRIRPVIFCPLEAQGASFSSLWRTIVSPPNTWGAIAAYDQVLHGWRRNSTAAHTLALTGTKVGAARRMTTTEALLQGAGIDPALASRVTISDLNMVSTDQSEEPLFPL